jgi:glycosyltransferase involved in cell wall biosynthesis
VGGGELAGEVERIAAADPQRFRVLPFQNQSRMPVVYRLADLFCLPSAFGETWGLAVNEALACGRPVLVSDRVGCAADVVDSTCGRIFPLDDRQATARLIGELASDRTRLLGMRPAATAKSWEFDTAVAEEALVQSLQKVLRS